VHAAEILAYTALASRAEHQEADIPLSATAQADTWRDVEALPKERAPGSPERQRRQRAFLAARRHSRWVKRLRVLLPLAGALVVLVFFAVTRLALPGDLDLTVAQLSVTRNSIIMDNPHLTGFDADRREYSVSADRAVQALTDPDKVDLEKIKALVTVTGQGTTEVAAESGSYDNAESALRLHGVIAVESSQGYGLRMNDAAIDFKAGTMSSPNPVTIRYQDSETSGDSIDVSGGGQVIVLEGGVRTTLMPPKRATAAPPAAPAKQDKVQ
jgi:lipopolysaccharide export system protein LptC